MTRVRKLATSTVRASAIVGTGLALMLGLAGAPAHAAATHIFASHSVTVPGLVRHQIDVHLNMSQSEAQSYIDNGAKIEIKCYGSDPIADDTLAGVPTGFSNTFTGSQHPHQPVGFGILTATPTGVHLTTLSTYEKGTRLNEDIEGRDEVYCKPRWIDRDGHTLQYKTNMQRGHF